MNDYKTIYDAIISGKGGGGNSMFNSKFGIIEPEYLYVPDYEHWDSTMDSYDNVSENTVIPFSDINSYSSFVTPNNTDSLNCLFKREKLEEKIYEIFGCDYGKTQDHCIGMIDLTNCLIIINFDRAYNDSKISSGACGPVLAGNSTDFRFVVHTINNEQYLMIDQNSY